MSAAQDRWSLHDRCSTDIVLPVASAFEREDLKIGFDISPEAQSLIQLRLAVVPPREEARPDTDIIFDPAQRLGRSERRSRVKPPASPARWP